MNHKNIFSSDDGNWETVIDFVKETGKGMPMAELIKSLETYKRKNE